MPEPFESSIRACAENAERLLHDARELVDYGRGPSALVLAVIAQEECAKGFLLHLANEGVVPWNPLVQRASRDHACKHLLGLVMDYLKPEFEEVARRYEELARAGYPLRDMPRTVADAINIFRHEKIGRWESRTWFWVDEPDYDATAVQVAGGQYDRLKQDALYVRLNFLGGVASTPGRISLVQAEEAIGRADRFRDLLHQVLERDAHLLWDYDEVAAAFSAVFEALEASPGG